MSIRLEKAQGIDAFIIAEVEVCDDTDTACPGHATGRDHLVQTDTDYPGVASSFGWWIGSEVIEGEEDSIVFCPSEHSLTDGTIKCDDCGSTPGHFITAAGDFLRDNIGRIAEDPGYFAEESAS